VATKQVVTRVGGMISLGMLLCSCTAENLPSTTDGGGTGDGAGEKSAAGAGSCPSPADCDGVYSGSFECFCEAGQYGHPVACEKTLDDVLATVGNDQTVLYGYAECGLAVHSVPDSLDGPQWYVFDLETRQMVGSRQTNGDGPDPTCSAGRLPDSNCAVTSCIVSAQSSSFCPKDCPAPPPGAAAGVYPTTFRFLAPAGETFFLLWDDCAYGPEISACIDGYAHTLHRRPYCEHDCAGADTVCVLCSPCLPRAVTVTDSSSADFIWAGELYEARSSSQSLTCPCFVRHPLTPGRYRMSMPVYASEQDALHDLPVFTVTREFDVTTPDAVVEVELQP